ncbi:CBASS cGAMP-activated phospholipase [Flavobacterium sp. SORGH_AS_0622]|uniref:CBASS cGAMP-activated phospholipase n=1 Tax=Flavobacterium sp. SORGH_AS_0622 TaxID=3041772 RepID=UPI002784E384|nr:CBASS cGAMP-activated phospholipase [Flavobacterium sp. SORGH_AS_0622]MDQ1167338.1 patatin-like phospholipase/acyl hydrolase [Flavobacterium sp. SORGH_AS_0622]
MIDKKFRVLSLDGGGIRGIFPAVILTEIEKELKSKKIENWQIYQNIDLIFGTSTGGILALALSLGIPAEEIKNLYFDNAKKIFGDKKGFFKCIHHSSHDRTSLKSLLEEVFKKFHNSSVPKLKDCKVAVGVSIYDLSIGKPSVLKSRYHDRFTRDPNLPLLDAALSTSSAPTYFDPYSGDMYKDLKGDVLQFKNKVDGGVWANNPSLIALIEAQKAFKKDLININLLSIGTGERIFLEPSRENKFGIWYWINNKRKRIIELFMQGQSQQVENIISLLKNGIDRQEPDNFSYLRLNTLFRTEAENIEMDETVKKRLEELETRALEVYKDNKIQIFKLLNIDLQEI